MSILVEALSVVIPRHVLDAGYPGGTEGYLNTARRARGARYALCDERLTCVSFATPAEVEAFTMPLDALGLAGEAGAPAPVACVDEDFGPTAPCPWLRWRRHGDGYTSCWLEWTEPGELITPDDWLPPRQRTMARGAPNTAQHGAGMETVSRHDPALEAPADASVPDAFVPHPPAPARRTVVGPLTPISTPAIVAAAGAEQAVAAVDEAFTRSLEEWSLPEFEAAEEELPRSAAAEEDPLPGDPGGDGIVEGEVSGEEASGEEAPGEEASREEASEEEAFGDVTVEHLDAEPAEPPRLPGPFEASADDSPPELERMPAAPVGDPAPTRLSDEAVDALFAVWEAPSDPAPEAFPDDTVGPRPLARNLPSLTSSEVSPEVSAPPSPSPTPGPMTAIAAAPTTSIEAILVHLAERGWRYSQDGDQKTVFYQAAGVRASYPGFATADEGAGLTWLYVQLPVRVPEHRRAAAVELLTRANHGLPVGNFEFDYGDGEVRFKTVADSSEGCFSAAAAGRLLHHALQACDRYHDPLMQVIYGGLSPAEAMG